MAVYEDSSYTFFVTADGSNVKYQWQQNDGSSWINVGQDTSAYHQVKANYSMNGYKYRCNLNSDCGAVITDSVTLTINKLNSIFHWQKPVDNLFTLFPNPFSTDFYLNSNTYFLYELYTLQGEKILSGGPFLTATLSGEKLASGLYILKVKTDSELKCYRIIKQ